MAERCTLAADINTCRFYDPEHEGCRKPDKVCLFLEKGQPELTKPVREEKWFEKYLK